MSAVTIHLAPDAVDSLRTKASRAGLTVEAYLGQLAERDAASAPEPAAELSAGEFERLLDDLSAGPSLPPLPADFSRADIYQSRG
jgi:hypothetical protein